MQLFNNTFHVIILMYCANINKRTGPGNIQHEYAEHHQTKALVQGPSYFKGEFVILERHHLRTNEKYAIVRKKMSLNIK